MWRHHNRAAGQEGDDPKSGLDPKLGGKGGKSVQHVRQKKIDWIQLTVVMMKIGGECKG